MIGFTEMDVNMFQKKLSRLERNVLPGLRKEFRGDMVQVIPGRESMMKGTLRQALATKPTEFEEMGPGRAKVLILSGMYPEEASDVVKTYMQSWLPKAAFLLASSENL